MSFATPTATGAMPPPTLTGNRDAVSPASTRTAGGKKSDIASPTRNARRDADRFIPSSRASRPNDATGSSDPSRSNGPSRANDPSRPNDASDPARASQTQADETSTGPAAPRDATGEELSKEEQQQVEELRARDREVRQHEQAHKAAAGQYATSGPTYSFQQGPDGRRYAVGGEVGIDTSKAETPEATIRKMQQVRRAALAPAEPSAQDRRVAARATQTASAARAELAEQRRAERSGENEPSERGDRPAESAQDNDAVDAAPATPRTSTDDQEPASDMITNETTEPAGFAISGSARLSERASAGRLVNIIA